MTVVVFERQPLLAALLLVGKVQPWQRAEPRYDPKDGKPLNPRMIPGVVRVHVRGGQAHITCANLNQQITTTVACLGGDDATLFLPLVAATSAVQKAAEGAQVALNSDGFSVILQAGRFKATTSAAEQDAPPEPAALEGSARPVSIALLRDGLVSTNSATLEDPKRPFLGGVFIHDSAAGPAFVGMDGNRIHSKTAQGEAINAQAILPRAAGRLLLSLLPEEGEVALTVGPQGASFQWGATTFRTRLIDAQFPRVREKLNIGSDRMLRAHADALLADLQLVTCVADPKTLDFHLDLSPEGSTASAIFRSHRGTDDGSVTLDAEFVGEPLRISFQLRLVSDALALFGEHIIEWRMGAFDAPTVISSPTMPGLDAVLAPFMQRSAPVRAQAA